MTVKKIILYNAEARAKLLAGVDAIANAVKVTLGPGGRNVALYKNLMPPIVTKDGVTVAKEVFLRDPIENIGALMVKEVATKTADVAGDGTTTATLLTQAIYREGLKNVTAGANPMEIKKGIEEAVKVVVNELKKMSRPVTSSKEIEQVATLSANGDQEIGRLIAYAMEKVGQDGVITVEHSKNIDTYLDVVEGMQIEKGYISPYFVTNNEKMIAELENPFILIYDKSINSMKLLIPILEQVARANRPLLIIADNVEGEALTALIVNNMRGTLRVSVIQAPAIGEMRKPVLEDIAIVTGGTVITEEQGYKLENATLDLLGSASKVIVDKDRTVIVGGKGSSEKIKARIEQIKNEIKKTTSNYLKEKMQERIAKLSNGVAVLYVGATTDTAMQEKKDRVEDALHATKAAVEEGIVPGGGVAYLRALRALSSESGLISLEGDAAIGVEIIKNALHEPLRQIANNAGKEGSIIVEKVKEGEGDFGWNAKTGKFENLFESGVIDPTKVVRVALENAASIASLMLTTECVISDAEEEKPEP